MDGFYDINSEELKKRMGVKDARTVLKKIKEIGAPIHMKGKSKYVLAEELISCIKASNHTSYSAKGKLSLR